MDIEQLEVKVHKLPGVNIKRSGAYEIHRIGGFIGDDEAGFITIERLMDVLNHVYANDYWFDMSTNPPTQKPHVFFQFTHENYRRIGICEKLIIEGDKILRPEFGSPLHSTIYFVEHDDGGRKVWEKLEKENKAIQFHFRGEPYWCLK